MCGWQLKLCDPLVRHRPYQSVLEMHHEKMIDTFTLLHFNLLYLIVFNNKNNDNDNNIQHMRYKVFCQHQTMFI